MERISMSFETGNYITDIDGKARSKEPLGRRRCRWEDNNKLDHREIG
jgi:hypothetical protein